jgi:hypothetical protein
MLSAIVLFCPVADFFTTFFFVMERGLEKIIFVKSKENYRPNKNTWHDKILPVEW